MTQSRFAFKRQLSGWEVLGLFVGLLALIVALGAFSAWMTMLILGGLHSFIPQVPAFSFWQSWLVNVALGFVASYFRRVSTHD